MPANTVAWGGSGRVRESLVFDVFDVIEVIEVIEHST